MIHLSRHYWRCGGVLFGDVSLCHYRKIVVTKDLLFSLVLQHTQRRLGDVNIPHTVCQYMHKLKHRAKSICLKRHSYIYLEEEPSDTVYMLEQGMVMLTKLLPSGQEVGIILLSGNNLFGQCEVIGRTAREHQAKTLTPTKVWMLKSTTFLEEAEKSTDFAMALAKLQNERLRHVEKHIGSIYQSSVSMRLTTTLLEIAHSSGCRDSKGASIKPCPTHQDLATMVSSTRETVSVIMGKLRKRNIIIFDRSELRILSEQRLLNYQSEVKSDSIL
jgi:CRP/FNR family transcriptional regulator